MLHHMSYLPSPDENNIIQTFRLFLKELHGRISADYVMQNYSPQSRSHKVKGQIRTKKA